MTRPALTRRLLPALLAALVVMGGLSATALAAPPVEVEMKGKVVLATMDLPVAPAAVLEVLSDLGSRVSPKIIDTRVEKQDGACQEVWNQAQEGPISLEIRVLRCRTETGWRETLLSSDLLRSLETEWQILPTAAGTRIELTMAVESVVPLPDFAKLRRLRSGASETLTSLALLVR